MDAGEEGKVVVDCVLSEASVQELRLSKTKGVSKKDAPPVEEATASLTDLTAGKTVGLFSRVDAEEGLWILPYSAIAGHTYRLEIDIPEHDPISAQQTMPQTVIRFYVINLGSSLSGEAGKTELVIPSPVPESCWIYGLSFNEAHQGEIVEELCTDYPFVDDFNLTGAVYDPPFLFQSEAPPFSFSCYSYYRLKGVPMHRRYLRIPKGADNGEIFQYYVSGSFEYSLEQIVDIFATDFLNKGEIVAMSLSEEYDRFLREALLLLEQQQSSTTLADIYMRHNIYSNVQGALGIFGAKTVSSSKWYVGPDIME